MLATPLLSVVQFALEGGVGWVRLSRLCCCPWPLWAGRMVRWLGQVPNSSHCFIPPSESKSQGVSLGGIEGGGYEGGVAEEPSLVLWLKRVCWTGLDGVPTPHLGLPCAGPVRSALGRWMQVGGGVKIKGTQKGGPCH